MIPEIGIEGNDAKFGVHWVMNRVSGIMCASLSCSGRSDPVVVLPEARDVLIVP